MSTFSVQAGSRAGPSNPRGDRIAAAILTALWRSIARLGQRVPPAPHTPAQQAQEVREMAVLQMRTDPRFAADLFAAADRHERLHGVE
jgi:hypothetical protein